ncbi:MAG: hypothetical protein K8R58_01840 [Bacteroidales bacterium]|nr:hypothetical protein [Bacteroidales bacterium]
MKILLYGYGNPGRQDDGLGNEFVNRMQEWINKEGIKNFEFESNYQLNIEDAHVISDKELVIFIDASDEDIQDFCISKVTESSKMSFTTHSASPGFIVDLCKKLFNKSPLTLLLHIKGYEWNLKEELTEKAEENLNKAMNYFKQKFKNPKLLIQPDTELKTC